MVRRENNAYAKNAYAQQRVLWYFPNWPIAYDLPNRSRGRTYELNTKVERAD